MHVPISRLLTRLVGVAAAVALISLLFAPVVLAADPIPYTGRVLISTGGDFTLPAGEQADAVIVVDGTATIEGEVKTIVVVDGAATLVGAQAETIVAVRSPIELGADSVVTGDVLTVDSLVHKTGNADVQGEVSDLPSRLIGIGVVLAPALLLLWLGFGLALIVAGLLLAGLAARQVRDAEAVISREPVMALASGIVGLIAFPILAVLLIITVVGAPLGIGILLMVWPLVAFIGYLIAGIWIGDWVLRRMAPGPAVERPYKAAIVGLLILAVLGMVPMLAVLSGIASLFGFGAVLLLAIRILRSHHAVQPTVPGSMPAPISG